MLAVYWGPHSALEELLGLGTILVLALGPSLLVRAATENKLPDVSLFLSIVAFVICAFVTIYLLERTRIFPISVAGAAVALFLGGTALNDRRRRLLLVAAGALVPIPLVFAADYLARPYTYCISGDTLSFEYLQERKAWEYWSCYNAADELIDMVAAHPKVRQLHVTMRTRDEKYRPMPIANLVPIRDALELPSETFNKKYQTHWWSDHKTEGPRDRVLFELAEILELWQNSVYPYNDPTYSLYILSRDKDKVAELYQFWGVTDFRDAFP